MNAIALARDSRWLALGRRTLRAWLAQAGPTRGAALAFYGVLALAPLLLVAVGLAGFFVGRDQAQAALVAQLALLLGERSALGIETLLDLAGGRDEGLTPALVGASTMVVAATAFFAELRASLDRIWDCRGGAARGALQHLAESVGAFVLVAAIGLLLLGSMLASTFLASVGTQVLAGSEASMHALEFLLSSVAVTLLFAVAYKLLPRAPVAWADVWAGAALASLLFWVGKFLIALYIAKAAVDSSFGAAGAVVIAALWVYWSAQVFFLGAQLTREHALEHGSPARVAGAIPLEGMNAPYAELERRARRLAPGAQPTSGP
jgi:membrane protein